MNFYKTCLGALIAGSLVTTPTLHANNHEDEDALLSIIQLLETDIATKTQAKDRDLAPGLVTVLRGTDLAARGVKTIAEALNRVAGISVPETPNIPVIRGVGGVLSSFTGKIKYLVNGAAAVDNITMSGVSVLGLPIDIVDRIEIIRGPGSAIHGEYAYLGVVNVITKSNSNQAFVRAGSFESIGAGINHSSTLSNNGTLGINVAVSKTDGPDLFTETDMLHQLGQGAVSNAPGFANEEKDQSTAIVQYNNDNVTASVQFLQLGSGDGFGIRRALPPKDEGIVSERSWKLLDVAIDHDLNDHNTLTTNLGYKKFHRHFDEAFGLPAGFFGIYPQDLIATSNDAQENTSIGLHLTNTAAANHTILAGVEYSRVKTKNVRLFLNQDLNNLIPGTPLPAPLPGLAPFPLGYEDRTRNITSVFIQDEYSPTDRFTLTTGVRVDDYSDAGKSTTPRIAGVYRVNDAWILKGQYGEAFRPPTFSELYNVTDVSTGNLDIEAEEIATTEFSLIRKTESSLFRATLFDSELENIIALDNTLTFENTGSADVQGLEIEFESKIGRTVKLLGDISFSDAEDHQSGDPLVGSYDRAINLAVNYQPSSRHSYVLDIQDVSQRLRGQSDARADLKGQTVANFTATFFDVFTRGLDVRVGITNITDEETRFPSPANTFQNDFPGAERAFWLTITKSLE